VTIRWILRAAFAFHLALLSSAASAYPATQSAGWRLVAGSAQCGTTTAYTYATAELACQTQLDAQAQFVRGYGCPNAGWTGTYAGTTVVDSNSTRCRVNVFYNGTSQYPNSNGFMAEKTNAYTCPNGGTLSGTTCVCPQGQTDTGTACSAVPPCPTGQFRRTLDAQCEAKCPERIDNGPIQFAAGQDPKKGACLPRMEFIVGMGWSAVPNANSAVDGPAQCEVASTGITVCTDYGSRVDCYSEKSYNLGKTCGSSDALTSPDDPTVCAAGDLYCEKGSGPCGTGFVAATFQGKALCVKSGEKVTSTPRTLSALDPPKSSPNPAPPTVSTGRDGVASPNPSDGGVVVAIGNGANTVGGAGGGAGGTGGGGQIDVETCGLPGKPPCKIDEGGTPSKGDFSEAKGKLDGLDKSVNDTVEKATGTSGKDTGWKIGFAPPTTCSNPVAFSFPKAGINWTPDLCSYQSQIHAIMSFLWVLFTLGSCLSMIRSTAAGGGV
jgi:hypothetical protein